MEIRIIDNRADWEALADPLLAPLQQRWLYGAALERLGRRVTRRAGLRDGQPAALAQAITRRVLGFPVHLASRAIGPNLPARGLALTTPEDARPAARLAAHLELGPDAAMRAAMHGKWRNRLARAERAGLTVDRTTPGPDALRALLRRDLAQQRARGYRALPPAVTRALIAADPDAPSLYTCEDAALLILRHGTTATYHIGHAGPRARACNAHNLMMWQVMCDLAATGTRRLDLGFIDPRTPGLNRFKLGTGAAPRPIGRPQLRMAWRAQPNGPEVAPGAVPVPFAPIEAPRP